MDPLTLTRLTVEHLVEPLGLATRRPRFGWVLDAAGEACGGEGRSAGGSGPGGHASTDERV